MGSSPLTRGARRSSRATVRGMGLIPAHAGSTVIASRGTFLATAHPRSRGEH
ncbi:hypothetical protein HMPREF0307_02207 [Corynebacterium sp. DNF00584]|nr:hypothetical protein HMPREF0307_02207 [Corynebacterium sp. DNF00584]